MLGDSGIMDGMDVVDRMDKGRVEAWALSSIKVVSSMSSMSSMLFNGAPQLDDMTVVVVRKL